MTGFTFEGASAPSSSPRSSLRSEAVVLTFVVLVSALGCSRAEAKPNCNRMRACCEALRGQEEGLPKEHEILCHHDPELDEGCSETLSDIAKFTPKRSLPDACR